MNKIISHRGTLTTIGDNKKSKYESRQRQLNDLSTSVILNDDPDMIDSTGIQNFVRLSHARPVTRSHQILDDSAFTHIAVDASMFESTRTIGWSDAESYFGDCDDRLIKQIIDKGRFSNQIAKALHEEKKTEMQYNLPVSGQSTMNHLNYKHSQSQLLSSGCNSEKIFGKLGSYKNSSENLLSKAMYEQ